MEKGHNFHSLIMTLKISNQSWDIQIPPLFSKPICLPVIHMTYKDTLHKNDVFILSQRTCLSAALPGGLRFAQTSQSPPIPERRDHLLLVLCAWFILFR